MADAQVEHHAAADPIRRFLDLVAAATTSGRAHTADEDGGRPADAAAWGWRQDPDGWRARGDCIGWVNETGDLYLEADAAYAVAQRLAADGGDSLGVTLYTLKARLHERGLLASTETRGGRLRREVRRALAGKRRSVLHLHADALGGSFPPAQSGPVAQDEDDDAGNVEKSGAPPLFPLGHSVGHSGDGQVAPQVAQHFPNTDTAPGTIGPPGPLPGPGEKTSGTRAVADVADHGAGWGVCADGEAAKDPLLAEAIRRWGPPVEVRSSDGSRRVAGDDAGRRVWLRAMAPERERWIATASPAEIAAAVEALLAEERGTAPV